MNVKSAIIQGISLDGSPPHPGRWPLAAALYTTKRQSNALGSHVPCVHLVRWHQSADPRQLCPMVSALAVICARHVAIRLTAGALKDRNETGNFPCAEGTLRFDCRLEMFTCRGLVQTTRYRGA